MLLFYLGFLYCQQLVHHACQVLTKRCFKRRHIGASFKLIQASLFSIHVVKRGKHMVLAFLRFGNMNRPTEQTRVTYERLD